MFFLLILDVKLQTKALKRTEDLLENLTEWKTTLEAHKAQWSDYCSNTQNKLTQYESIWDIFHQSGDGIGAYIKQTDNLIKKLRLAKDELSRIDQHESLKCQVEKERATLTKLEQKKAELEEQLKKVKKEVEKEQKKPAKSKKSSANTSWNCFQLQEEPLSSYQHQISLESSEQRLNNKIKNEKEKFCTKQKELYEQFKTIEIDRCLKLKQYAKKYFEAFVTHDKDGEFTKTYENYNEKDDMENWDKHIFNNKNLNKT